MKAFASDVTDKPPVACRQTGIHGGAITSDVESRKPNAKWLQIIQADDTIDIVPDFGPPPCPTDLASTNADSAPAVAVGRGTRHCPTGDARSGQLPVDPVRRLQGRQRLPLTTPHEVAEANVKVCPACEKIHHPCKGTSHTIKAPDPNHKLVVAFIGQQALAAEGDYLQTTLTEEAAAPAELALAVQKLVDVSQSLTINFLNGQGSLEVDHSLRAVDEATLAIHGICKLIGRSR